MTTKRIRWNCPNGAHPGVLGPSRPSKDSVLRYCLACTTEAGHLVQRVAPTLERKRAAAAVSTAAKAKARRHREALARECAKQAQTARYSVEGIDLRDEFKRLIRLRAFGGRQGRLFRSPPEFVISRRNRPPTSRLGYAEPWRNRITIATYPGQTLADARETLVHELTHIVVGTEAGNALWHGPLFHTTMSAAFKQAYKVTPVGVRENSYHGRYAAALRRAQ